MARRGTDTEVIMEAKGNFTRTARWESYARRNFLEDLKFAEADADNAYQWPNDIRRNREIDQRPCLTINKTRQFNLQILNDMRDNKPSPKVIAVGSESNKASADIFQGVIRHIEDISNADATYQLAADFQVKAGIGYWRLETGYAAGNTFDQEIFIRPILDPLSVYMDPDIKEKDGSDAKFAFHFENMLKTEFNERYPKFKNKGAQSIFGDFSYRTDDDHYRVCEYYRRVDEEDTLIFMPDVNQFVRESTIRKLGADNLTRKLLDEDRIQRRTIITTRIEWYVMSGMQILEEGEIVGTYIPIIRVPGEESIIDGRMDRKGHTRALKDPQRMYNYWSSSAVEALAIQTKTPWLAPAAAIENYEVYWRQANRANTSVLPYNNRDDDGNEIAPPQRINPPTMPSGFMSGMEVANNEMMMASGQYQSMMGQPANERTGKAINNRQRQGDRATLHYADNLGLAIRHTGRVLVQWVPLIYDTARVIRILGEDGTEDQVTVNPQAAQAMTQQRNVLTGQVQKIFNPKVGRYDVRVTIGPSYATRRQEAFDALMMIIAQNQQIAPLISDLAFRSADFPGSEELADRLKRTVPPEVLGEAPPPNVQAMQAQVAQLQQLVETLTATMQEKDLKYKKLEADREIEGYRAISDRMKVLGAGMTPDQVLATVQQLLVNAQLINIEPETVEPQIAPMPNGQGM